MVAQDQRAAAPAFSLAGEARDDRGAESRIQAQRAALPGPEAVDRLIRYETSNDRALDRALKRLEVMQARRGKQGNAPPEK